MPVVTSTRLGLLCWSSTHKEVDFFSNGTFGILKRRAPFGTRNGLSLLAVTIVTLAVMPGLSLRSRLSTVMTTSYVTTF